MRKEVVFAVIIGVLIGLVFAFGLFRVNGIMKTRSAQTTLNNNISATPSEKKDINKSALTLLKPFDKEVFGNDIIQISGVTKAESFIIVTGGTGDLIVKNGSDGTFDLNYELEPSLNDLGITSVTSANERLDTNLEVVYSSEAEQKNTSDLKNSIENKLEMAQNRAEFYKGTITDLTNGGLQMKNSDGEIRQVSYTSGTTTFAKIGKTSAKITESDIAIGDYILALGYKRGDGVLDAFRILVTQPSTPAEVKIFYGVVSMKNKTDMEITEQNSGNITVEIDNNTKTYSGELTSPTKVRFANIKEGDSVIGTYITEKNSHTARRIYILNSAE